MYISVYLCVLFSIYQYIFPSIPWLSARINWWSSGIQVGYSSRSMLHHPKEIGSEAHHHHNFYKWMLPIVWFVHGEQKVPMIYRSKKIRIELNWFLLGNFALSESKTFHIFTQIQLKVILTAKILEFKLRLSIYLNLLI